MNITELSLDSIQAGDNDRTEFNPVQIAELAASIAAVGLAQPITVCNGLIVAGERRYRAHVYYTAQVNAGLWPVSPHVRVGYIKAIVRDDLTPEQASEIMLIENVQRVDLDPIAEAKAYQKRMRELGWSIAKVAEVVKKSHELVKTRLKLLDLNPEIQAMVKAGQLKTHYAEEIAALDSNRQNMAIDWLHQQAYPPTRRHMADFVASLSAHQQAESLFDFNQFFTPQAVEVAQSDSGKRVSDCLPILPHLPELPDKTGDAGRITDGYIAVLLEQGHTQEARVLLDFWRKMMKCNRLQVKPWDSQVLTHLKYLE